MKFKSFVSISVAVLFITILFIINGYSFILSNGASGSYGDGNGETASLQSVSNNTIEYYIMEGGSYYLEANSHIQALLKKVEQQDILGIYYFDMMITTDSIRYNLQKAVDSYEKLISLAEATPYNPVALEKLRVFDYDAFARDRGLSKECFAVVQDYLYSGNITGVLKQTYNDMNTMLDLVNKARISLYRFQLPDLSLFWQLNEKQASSALFGSYVARVFSAIRD